MEISPAKSLGIVSDSEGEEDRIGTTTDDLFEREVNAARFSDPRDWHHNQPAAIATNLSSYISESPSLPEKIPIMQIESSGIGDFDSSATKPRPRPRPRMRPVPPPDQPDSSSIGTFSTIPPNLSSAPETLASFDNSTVQAVPVTRPPSLPPSSLPGADTAPSSVPIPTFPTSVPLLESFQTTTHLGAPKASSGDVLPPTETTSANPNRPRPKMRPPPPPEPDIGTTGVMVTASSATTTSSAGLHATASTGATSVSSTSKSDPSRSSALEEAEEYTGRGARRIAQTSKPSPELPPFLDHDIDVGGPEDNQVSDVIMLISSEDEYSGSKTKSKVKAKPKTKPKPKKKDVPNTDSTPARPDNIDEPVPAPVKSTLKRKSAKLQSSDDEFGKWDNTIPGGSAPSGKHKKPGIPDSDVQSGVPNPTGLPKSDPTGGPGYRRATSSPLSSPGHSPELKRKSPLNVAAEESVAQSPTKKPRKSDFVGVVLTGPSNGNGKPPKRARKKTAKAAAAEDGEGGDTQARIPPALDSVENISAGILPSESSNTNAIPSNSSGSQTVAQESETPPMDIDTTSNTKKESKKRAPKGKKGAANEESAVESPAQGGPTPKEAKGKRKGKGKEPVSAMARNDTGVDSSNLDADTVPATSSNLGPGTGPQPVSSNSSAAPAPTPAAKPKPRPRHSTTPAPLPVAMGASGSLLRSASGKSTERPLSETLRLALGGTGSPATRMGLSRRGSSKIAPLLAFRGAPPPPPPPMPKKPTKKKKGASDDEDSEEGPDWEGLTEKQKEKKRREKEMAGWYSDG